MPNWEIILGSSVVAGIISALLTLYSNSRKNTLERITDERGKWRVALRQITYELEACYMDKEQTRLVLAKLKHKINPYGKLDIDSSQNAFFFNDGSIWRAIELYNAFDRKRLNILQLRIYLALKYDWERSKEEIRTNIALPFSLLFAIFGGLFFYMNIESNVTTFSFSKLTLIFTFIISLVFYPLVATRFSVEWPLVIVIVFEVFLWFYTFSLLNLASPTGILALVFCLLSIVAMIISEGSHLYYKMKFIKAAKAEYEQSGDASSTPVS